MTRGCGNTSLHVSDVFTAFVEQSPDDYWGVPSHPNFQGRPGQSNYQCVKCQSGHSFVIYTILTHLSFETFAFLGSKGRGPSAREVLDRPAAERGGESAGAAARSSPWLVDDCHYGTANRPRHRLRSAHTLVLVQNCTSGNCCNSGPHSSHVVACVGSTFWLAATVSSCSDSESMPQPLRSDILGSADYVDGSVACPCHTVLPVFMSNPEIALHASVSSKFLVLGSNQVTSISHNSGSFREKALGA